MQDENTAAASQDGGAAPAEQSGAPTASQAPAEQPAPTKSANETRLEGQLKDAKAKGDGYKKERDTARTELAAARGELTKVSEERDALRTENEHLKAEPSAPEVAPEAAAQQPSQEEYIKGLLKRNGLQKAWILPSGACFSEEHAKEFAGHEFDSLTVINVE